MCDKQIELLANATVVNHAMEFASEKLAIIKEC
jgi:hypothetical protein